MPVRASRRVAAKAVAGLIVTGFALRHPEAALAAPLLAALLEWWR